ncbi:MAG: hypothetical protein MJ112_01735 [Lachnospiraceae bacterium]|nr:hypothetical protein [Lachnospiraceae bacterium]
MSQGVSVNTSLVKDDGVKFCEYGQVLRDTMLSIDKEIEAITTTGLAGKANSALINKYADIKDSAMRFATMISTLGMKIQNVAVENANTDETSAQSAETIKTL